MKPIAPGTHVGAIITQQRYMDNIVNEQSNLDEILDELSPDDPCLQDPDADSGPDLLQFDDKYLQQQIFAGILTNRDILAQAAATLPPKAIVDRYRRSLIEIAIDYFNSFQEVIPEPVLRSEYAERIKDQKPEQKAVALAMANELLSYVTLDSPKWVVQKLAEITENYAIKLLTYDFTQNRDAAKFWKGVSEAQQKFTVKAPEDTTFGIGDRIDAVRPAWLIKGFLRKNSIGVMYGASNCGKTWLALDAALSVATGAPFLGTMPTKQCGVFYVIAEGGDDFELRATAWLRSKQISAPSTSQFVYRPNSYNFSEDSAVELVKEHIKEKIGEVGLIIVDTLSKNFTGDQDNNSEVSAFINKMERLRDETGATILVIHHCGHQVGRERGASSLRAGVDTSIQVEEVSETPLISKMTCQKQKMGKKFEKLVIGFDIVRLPEYDTEDEEMTGLVGRLTTDPEHAATVEERDKETISVHSIIDAAFLTKAAYTQNDLIAYIQGKQRERGDGITGKHRITDMLKALLTTSLKLEKGENNANVYMLM